MNRNRKERIRDGLYGLLVGDALGVPYEFHPPENIPPSELIDMVPPSGFERSHAAIKPGTWSDDGAQALCLLDSLLTCDGLDLKDFADRLIAWVGHGLWAIDKNVFDCGIQTMQALRAYASGKSPKESGFVVPDGKGNGALMRTLPVAFFQNDAAWAISTAQMQARVTHGHVCNQVCCALYTLWAKGLLDGKTVQESYQNAVSLLTEEYQNQPEYLYELECCTADGNPTGTGYVVDSIRSTRYLLEQYDTYEGVVKGAVLLGNDTDTTAAIAGGLAGIAYGNIPKRWMTLLRGKEMVEPLLKQLDKKEK